MGTVTRIGLDMMTFGSYELMRQAIPEHMRPETLLTAPEMPKPGAVPIPGAPPPPPDPADLAMRSARIMERRRQLGLQGRMSTFLTTAQGDQAPAQSGANTLLGS